MFLISVWNPVGSRPSLPQGTTDDRVVGMQGRFQCPKCSSCYFSSAGFVKHVAKCDGTNPLMCPICQRLFKRPYAVKDHLNGFHGMGEQVVCQFCGKHFKYKTSLYVHMCPEKEKHKRDQMTS